MEDLLFGKSVLYSPHVSIVCELSSFWPNGLAFENGNEMKSALITPKIMFSGKFVNQFIVEFMLRARGFFNQAQKYFVTQWTTLFIISES